MVVEDIIVNIEEIIMGKILLTTKSGTIVNQNHIYIYKITHENECYKCDMEKCGMEANDTSIDIDLPNTLN